MFEIVFALLMFLTLTAAALTARHLTPRLASQHVSDETNNVIRLVANLFVVMTSLVFGLLINSSRAGFESLDNQVHSYSTHLILLDRSLSAYGPDADPTRVLLARYVELAIANPARLRRDETLRDYSSEHGLTAVGDALAVLVPADAAAQSLLDDIRQQYQQLVEERWDIIEAAQRSVPVPLIAMLAAWLALIFASFGYRAPKNGVVTACVTIAAALISGSLYLVMDMNRPFSGPMQISDAPLRQVLSELRRDRTR
ncbi:DUF4239 domain-containing protein [Paracoccus shanxieyensis]|uniref:DUF4239 domain-containing protein n=1 Tax=Paracoccus shanxieyensis TaxID=2675752 RepID=A0A6L6IW28_9RHOB|nr:DUF4239 domain-containing protein [Paracoccus shanxieyensis]MTH64413.1 DUF4239 domain-containing protein [Paracoccus shanxieyensis]MTH87594.1 DUF4239 domain-containing protein [Paracoccus shanxieyensis]